MKLLLPVGLCLGLLALTAGAADNVAEFNARVWQSDEGLPVDAAWTAAQTPDGFLWVGTRAGLARFDGVHFDIFDTHNVPGMTSPNITGLRAARDGCLWATTGEGGVYRLKDGHFSHFGKAEGLAADECVGSIYEDPQGAIWVGTLRGLCRFEGGAFKKICDDVVRGFCLDSSGVLWLATTNGIHCWSNGTFVLHLGTGEGLVEPDVRAICVGPDDKIWVGTGAEVRRVEDGVVKPFLSGQGPNYNLVTALYRDRRGNYWAGTYSGLNQIVDGKFVPEYKSDGLPYGTVMGILEDHEDNLWVSAKDGLIRLKPNRVSCYTQRQGLGSDNVSAVLEDQAGDICVGTWGGGLNRLHNGIVTTYTNAISYPGLVLGMCQDRAGHFWVGTDFNRGLYELDGERIRHFVDLNGMAIPAVRVIFEDHATNLWVGTSHGLFQMRDGKLLPFGDKHELADDVVRAIAENPAGNLWIGTQAGLVRERDGAVTRFAAADGLTNQFILDVYADRKNTVWLGTFGGGLTRFRDGVFTTYGTRDGLFSDNVCAIIEDDRGWLWMGSDRGIFRVRRKNIEEFDAGKATKLRSISYGKSDGMANKICNAVAKPSVCKSRDGRLWFTTIEGLCVIDPQKTILPEAPAPPVVIEQIQTEQETVADPEKMAGLVRFKPGQGELEFRYAALAFHAPEENRYKYRLEGLDSDWVDADRRQIAHYNNIYPGHYRFRVIACNSDGVWNEAGATVTVVMLPHFWQTWLFKPALLALAAGALAIVYRIILLRRQDIERLRIRIAADLHDEIGGNLASIALLSQLGEKGPAKADHSELSEINRIALLTVNGIREIVWFINPEYDTMPELNARLRDVAAQMLIGIAYKFESPVHSGGGKLSPDFRRNVFLIFKEILHNIVSHAHAMRVEIMMRETQGTLLLHITDDGRGFDPAAVRRGNGLKNLRLRAAQLGGTVEISGGASNGTVVTVSVRIT